LPDFPAAVDRLDVFQFSHGQSNPTYLIKASTAVLQLQNEWRRL
jgi:hypothetical protein